MRRGLQEALELLSSTPPYVMDPVPKIPVRMWDECPVYVAPVPQNETKGTSTNLTSRYVVKLRGTSRVRPASLPGGDRLGVHVDYLPAPATENTVTATVFGAYGLWCRKDEYCEQGQDQHS